MQVVNDVVVGEDATLTVADNATVVAAAKQDARTGLVDHGRVELLANGDVDIAGDLGPVTFTSSRDPTFVHYSGADTVFTAGETEDAGPSDWYGIRVPDLAGFSVESAAMRYARGAIALENSGSAWPSLVSLKSVVDFEDNTADVSVDRDRTVTAEQTLSIPVGMKLGFRANHDAANVGVDSSRIELIVNGTIDFQGQDYYNRVMLLSDDPDSTDAQKKGDWYGMRLQARPPSGGHCGSAGELDFTMIRDAVRAIAVQDTCLMTLNWPLFANNDQADIFLDCDVRNPEGRQIDLRAPTRVVASTLSAYDHAEGEPDIVDLINAGDFETRRPGVAQESDWVVFESTAKDSVYGNDWGGIVVTENGTADIEDADIGFAQKPVYFASVDGDARLLNSRIHHFSEYGVLDIHSAAHIEGCSIERGAGRDIDAHETAVRLFSSAATVENNQIGWQDPYAIWFGTESSYCRANVYPPPPTETLSIVGNRIIGDDGASNRQGSAGIFGEWLCHEYEAVIEADTLETWSGRALHLVQAADVDVRCNRIEDNFTGVVYDRDGWTGETGEGPVRFYGNTFKRSHNRNFRVIEQDSLQLYDGGNGTSAGKNSFQKKWGAGAGAAKNITKDLCGVLNAGMSTWLDSTGTAITDSATIRATNELGCGDILLSPILSTEQTCAASAAQASRRETAVLPDGLDAVLAAQQAVSLPTEWSLGGAMPNPVSRWPAEIAFDVPAGYDGPVRVALYNVNGRRVGTVQDGVLPAGRYRRTWSGTDDQGRRMSSGVYFLRLDAGDHRMTKKFVVLH